MASSCARLLSRAERGLATASRRRGAQPLLWGRSAYSLLRGTALPAALLRRAAEFGYRACGLFDRENLYGACAFLEAAEQEGIRPLLGAELRLPRGLLAPLGGGRGAAESSVRSVPGPSARLLLVCRDLHGYRALARTLTRFHLQGAPAAVASLCGGVAGLSVLTDDPSALGWLREGFAPEELGALVLRAPRQEEREARLFAAARRFGVTPIAACRAFELSRDEGATRRLLAAIRTHALWGAREEARAVGAERGGPGTTREGGLLPGAAAAAQFRDLPEALAGAEALAERCRLKLGTLAPGRVRLPQLGLADAPRRLRARCLAGLRAQGLSGARAARRLARELRVIEALGYVDYFLIVGMLVEWARAQGIPVMGRGSGAASVVTYALGITNVDPVRYRLCFERFLHPLRRDPPDLDLDVAWDRRDELVAYALERFGAERSALVGTHQFFRARGAWREAARAHGLSEAQIAWGQRRLPRAFFGADRDRAGGPRRGPEAEALADLAEAEDRAVSAAARGALGLLGLPRNLGTHAAGLVVAPGAISAWVPLERSAAGYRVTQFEMRAIERLGLVKIDLLGNRALATVAEACARAGGLALAGLPGEDRATGRLLSHGETLGCIQLESPAMRTLLQQLGAADREQVIAAIALVRPGPAGSGMKAAFIRRARGAEPVRVLHPSLLTALEKTFGLPLYEEDVLTMAALIGGLSLAEADLLRRAVAAAVRRAQEKERGGARAAAEGARDLRRLEEGFRRAAAERGVSAGAARGVWEALVRFAAYAFCRAHAAVYGALAYQMAWLKAHHPGPFFAALLNHQRGMYPLRVYVDEARRQGLRLEPPCLARGELDWQWMAEPRALGTLRAGLRLVRGLHRANAAALIAARAEAPFDNLTDLARRVPLSLPELEALVLSGAADAAFARPRGELLCELRRWARGRRSGLRSAGARGAWQTRLSLMANPPSGSSRGPWKALPARQRARLERRFLGVSLACHPAELPPAEGAPGAGVAIAGLGESGRARVTVRGIVSARRQVRDARGRALVFVTLEDASGLIECTIREPLAARDRPRVDQWISASGRLRRHAGALGLQVDALRLLGAY